MNKHLLIFLLLLPCAISKAMEESNQSSPKEIFKFDGKNHEAYLSALRKAAWGLYIQDKALGFVKRQTQALLLEAEIYKALQPWSGITVSTKEERAAFEEEQKDAAFPIIDVANMGQHTFVTVFDYLEKFNPDHPSVRTDRLSASAHRLSSLEALVITLRYRDLFQASDISKQYLPIIKKLMAHPHPEVQSQGNFLFHKKACNAAHAQTQKIDHVWGPFYSNYVRYCCFDIFVNHAFDTQHLSLLKDIETTTRKLVLEIRSRTIKEFDKDLMAIINERANSVAAYEKQLPAKQSLYTYLVQELKNHIRQQKNKTLYAYSRYEGAYKNEHGKKEYFKEEFPLSLVYDTQLPAIKNKHELCEEEVITLQPSVDEELVQRLNNTHVATPPQKKKKKKKKQNTKSAKHIVYENELTKEEEEEETEEASSHEIASTLTPVTETDVCIEIKEPNVSYLLYKIKLDTENQSATKPLSYAPRVQQWFNNPQNALQEQGYFDQQHKNYTPKKYHFDVITRHAFSKTIDMYFDRLAIPCPWTNPRTSQTEERFCIPGEIRYLNDAGTCIEKKLVLFTYTFDPTTNVCYHRCATIKPSDEFSNEYLLKGYWQVHYDEEFPPLGS